MREKMKKYGTEEAGLIGGDGDIGEGVSQEARDEMILREVDLRGGKHDLSSLDYLGSNLSRLVH